MDTSDLWTKLKDTTVDTGSMTQYLYNVDLPNLKWAIDMGADEEIVRTLNHTDFFSVRLRFYLSGFRKTLHQTFEEMRWLLAQEPLLGADIIRHIISRIREDILKNEWYELMPRLDSAAVKIDRFLNSYPA